MIALFKNSKWDKFWSCQDKHFDDEVKELLKNKKE